MTTRSEETIQDFHKKFAVECFNLTWDLIDKSDRSIEEELEMIHAAHASRYHWGVVGGPINIERGEWQVSRVYAEVGIEERSLYHANMCLKICIENGIGDFDLAFAYEAITRAYALGINKLEYEENKALAIEIGERILDEDDRKYFLSEITII